MSKQTSVPSLFRHVGPIFRRVLSSKCSLPLILIMIIGGTLSAIHSGFYLRCSLILFFIVAIRGTLNAIHGGFPFGYSFLLLFIVAIRETLSAIHGFLSTLELIEPSGYRVSYESNRVCF